MNVQLVLFFVSTLATAATYAHAQMTQTNSTGPGPTKNLQDNLTETIRLDPIPVLQTEVLEIDAEPPEPVPEQDFYLSFEKSSLKGESPVGLYATALKKKQIKELGNETKQVTSFSNMAAQMTHRVTIGKNAKTIRAFLDRLSGLSDTQLDQLAKSDQAMDYFMALGTVASDLFSKKFMATGQEAAKQRKEILAGLREAVRQNGSDLHISNQFPDKYMNLIRNWLVMETDRTVGGKQVTRYRNSTAHMAKGGQEAALQNIKGFANRIDEIDAQKKPESLGFSYRFPVTKYKGCITTFTNNAENLDVGMEKALAQFNAGKPVSEQIILVRAPAANAVVGDSIQNHDNRKMVDELAFQDTYYQKIRAQIIKDQRKSNEVLSIDDFEKDMRRLYANTTGFTLEAMKKKWNMDATLSDDSLVAMASYATKRAQYDLAQSKRFYKKRFAGSGRNADMFRVAITTDLLNEIYDHRSSEGCKSNKDRGAMVMMVSMALDESAAESALWNLSDPVEAEDLLRELQKHNPEFFCEEATLDDLVKAADVINEQISNATDDEKSKLEVAQETLVKKIKVKNYLMVSDHYKAINDAQYHTTISSLNAPGASGVKSQGEHNAAIGNMQGLLPRQMMPSIMAEHYKLISPDFLARKNIENALAEMNKKADHKMLDYAKSWTREAKAACASYLTKNQSADQQLADDIFGKTISTDSATNLSLLELMHVHESEFNRKATALYEKLQPEQREAIIAFERPGVRESSIPDIKQFIDKCQQLQRLYPLSLIGIPQSDGPNKRLNSQVVKRLVKYVIDSDRSLISQPLDKFKEAMYSMAGKASEASVLLEGLKYRALLLSEQAYEQGEKQVESGFKKCLQRDAIAKYGIKNYDMNNPLHEALFEYKKDQSIDIFSKLHILTTMGYKKSILSETLQKAWAAPVGDDQKIDDKEPMIKNDAHYKQIIDQLDDVINGERAKEKEYENNNPAKFKLIQDIEPDMDARIGLRKYLDESNQTIEAYILKSRIREVTKPRQTQRQSHKEKRISSLDSSLKEKLADIGRKRKIVDKLLCKKPKQKDLNKQDKKVITAYQRALALGCSIENIHGVLNNNKLDTIEKLGSAMDEAAATELGLEGQSHQGSWIQQFQEDDQGYIRAAYHGADTKLRSEILTCVTLGGTPDAIHQAINRVLVHDHAQKFLTKHWPISILADRGHRLITAYHAVEGKIDSGKITNILTQRVMRRNMRDQLEKIAKGPARKKVMPMTVEDNKKVNDLDHHALGSKKGNDLKAEDKEASKGKTENNDIKRLKR